MLPTGDLVYDLPASAIATRPAEPRDAARLMVVSRRDQTAVTHATVRDLPSFLRPGDLLVLNTTRVLPARLEGERADTGGKVGGLYLRSDEAGTAPEGERRWIVLLQGKRLRAGLDVRLHRADGSRSGVLLRLIGPSGAEPGSWVVGVTPRERSDEHILLDVGRTPLPPYILAARRQARMEVPDSYDRERYQTVYADERGSVAAPTAGLHLNGSVLGVLDSMGVGRIGVVLHVGMGTFKPVETEFVEQHPIHSEWCSMDAAAVRAILAARDQGRRVICVGTTAARTVETYGAAYAAAAGCVLPASISTRLLITPGYCWRWTDGLLTNFHLPRSTLLAMCGALFPGGVHRLKELYGVALGAGYRFFSYGDAMLILP